MGWLVKGHPMYISTMLVVSLLLALALTTQQPPPAKPRTFEEIAKQADAARTADHIQQAIELYTQGLRLRPSWAEGWWLLGSLLYDQDRFQEARAAFIRFTALTSKPGPAYAFLGLCEYETQDYDAALKHFRSWARAGWSGTPNLIDVAVFHFALLLTRDGKFLEALYLLATEEAKKGSSPALVEAMGLASLCMTNLPEDYPPERREMVWLVGEAAFYASLDPRDFARANEYAARLLSRFDREPNVHFFRGTLYNFEHKGEQAAAEFRKVIELFPDHAAAMVELARIDLTYDRPEEALSLAKRATELTPVDSEAHDVMGQALFARDRFLESVQELETAKRLAPDSSMIRVHLARTYGALGRKREAQEEIAAVKLLKDKEQILAPLEEKTRVRAQHEPTKRQ
jgi:tetratricopeptide (TPR) repeat protein